MDSTNLSLEYSKLFSFFANWNHFCISAGENGTCRISLVSLFAISHSSVILGGKFPFKQKINNLAKPTCICEKKHTFVVAYHKQRSHGLFGLFTKIKDSHFFHKILGKVNRIIIYMCKK